MIKKVRPILSLPISFGAVVGLAEHLAVGDVGRAAFRPCRDVVGAPPRPHRRAHRMDT